MTTSYEAWLEQEEERTAIPMTAGEYDREETYIGGSNHPDREWLCSDRDVWYRNPFFTGTRTEGHPEDEPLDLTPEEEAYAVQVRAEWAARDERQAREREELLARIARGEEDDLPF